MRITFAAVALATLFGACAPESDKTNPAIATEGATAERSAAAPASGANSFTQEQARERATQAGYMDVGALAQAADGIWQGAAMKDGASVTVVVDYQGNVTSQAVTMPSDGSTPPVTVPPGPAPTTPPKTPAPTTPASPTP